MCDRYDVRRLPMHELDAMAIFREFLSAGIKNSQGVCRQVRDVEKFQETNEGRKRENL